MQIVNLIQGLKNKEFVPTDGVMPVMVILPFSAVMMVLGSLVSKAPTVATLQRFFAGSRTEAVSSVDDQAASMASAPVKI